MERLGRKLANSKGMVDRVRKQNAGIQAAGLFCLMGLLVAACQPLQPLDGSASSTTSGSETTLPAEASAPEENSEEGGTMIELAEDQQALADMARSELADELGMSMDAIHVTDVEAVDWPDSSLGCPEDGMMYAQVITSGYRIMLDAADSAYEFHGAFQGEGRVVQCKDEG